jgi:hypothetical protein
MLDGFLNAARADGIKRRLEPGWMDVECEREALGRPAPQGAVWVIADERVTVVNPGAEVLPNSTAAQSIGGALDAPAEPSSPLGSSSGSPPGSPASVNKATRMDELDDLDESVSSPSGEPSVSLLSGRIVRVLADGHDAFLRGQAPHLLMVVVEILVPPPARAEGSARGAAPTPVTVTLPASVLNGGRGIVWRDAAVERTEAGPVAVLVADGQRVPLAHSSLAQLRPALVPVKTAIVANLSGLLEPPMLSAKNGDAAAKVKPVVKLGKTRAVIVATELEAGCWPRYILETAGGTRVPGVTQDRIVKVVANKARKKDKRRAKKTEREVSS